jgi:dnd system-associated protein 4
LQQSAIAPRIRRPLEEESFIKQLAQEEDAPFSTMRELLVFAAALALSRGEGPLPFEKSSEPIPFQVFESAQLDKFIDTLALVVTEDHNILVEEKLPDRIAIFEGLAARGLDILRREIGASRGRAHLDVLRDLVLDEFKGQGQEETSLDHLLSELEG